MPKLALSRGVFACALAYLALLTGPSLAHAEDSCVLTLDSAREVAQSARDDDQANIREYRGEQAASLLASVNAVPPATNYHADLILVISEPGQIRVAFVVGDCVEDALTPPPSVWNALVRSALGDAS